MPNPATTPDVQDRFRPLTVDEIPKVQALLADAWALLTGRLPNLEANLTAGLVSVQNVKRVVCSMVIRVLQNPQGLLEESIDDYRYRRDVIVSSGVLHVTPDELADLTPNSGRRVNSVRLVAYGED